MQYLGHHPDGSSVQQHSAGSHYPLVLQFRDTPDLFAVEVLGPPGEVIHAERIQGKHDRAMRLEATRKAREWAQERAATLKH